MGYVPPNLIRPPRNLDNILGKERGMLFSELAAMFLQVASAGYSMSAVADSFGFSE